MERHDEELERIQLNETINKILDTIKPGQMFKAPIESITVSENVREKIDLESPEFKHLMATIKYDGVIHHPTVTFDFDHGRILCFSGHRRILALRALGEKSVKVLRRENEAPARRTMGQLIENVARKNLTPLELAKAVVTASKEDKTLTKSHLAELLGRDRKYVERLFKISAWSREAHQLLSSHPKELNLKFVMSLASRQISNEDLIDELGIKLKTSHWPKDAQQFLASHPKELGLDFVRDLVGRKIKDEELMNELKTKIGLNRTASFASKEVHTLVGNEGDSKATPTNLNSSAPKFDSHVINSSTSKVSEPKQKIEKDFDSPYRTERKGASSSLQTPEQNVWLLLARKYLSEQGLNEHDSSVIVDFLMKSNLLSDDEAASLKSGGNAKSKKRKTVEASAY